MESYTGHLLASFAFKLPHGARRATRRDQPAAQPGARLASAAAQSRRWLRVGPGLALERGPGARGSPALGPPAGRSAQEPCCQACGSSPRRAEDHSASPSSALGWAQVQAPRRHSAAASRCHSMQVQVEDSEDREPRAAGHCQWQGRLRS